MSGLMNLLILCYPGVSIRDFRFDQDISDIVTEHNDRQAGNSHQGLTMFRRVPALNFECIGISQNSYLDRRQMPVIQQKF